MAYRDSARGGLGMASAQMRHRNLVHSDHAPHAPGGDRPGVWGEVMRTLTVVSVVRVRGRRGDPRRLAAPVTIVEPLSPLRGFRT